MPTYQPEQSVTRDGADFIDGYGDRWIYYTDDASGHWAVDHEDGDQAGEVTRFADGSLEVARRRDGDTFGVTCTEEFVVEGGQWTENS
jgi:hypothetical protein